MTPEQERTDPTPRDELLSLCEELVELAMDIEDDALGEQLIHIGARVRSIGLRM